METMVRISVQGVDWSTLSPRSKEILRLIALPISSGCSNDEVATMLGRTTRWVNRRLAELREEIEQQLR
jgi:DNA-binding CsgD family transcriptional regulator